MPAQSALQSSVGPASSGDTQSDAYAPPMLLITAKQGYPAMERLIMGATRELFISLHAFQPDTECRSDEAKAEGLTDWTAMLVDAAARGVTIRILLNDFDPVGAPEHHEEVWNRVETLFRTIAEYDVDKRRAVDERLRMRVAHPGGGAGWMIAAAFWPLIRSRVHRLKAKLKSDTRAPGLRELVDTGGTARYWPPKMPLTQSFHQKFLIADGERAIVGGLDVDERRFDTPRHDRRPDQTWHDVTSEISGPPVQTLRRHFVHCWNMLDEDGVTHAPAFIDLADGHYGDIGRIFEAGALDDGGARNDPDADAEGGNEPPDEADRNPMRTVTTYGKPLKRGAFNIGPVPFEKGIETAYLDLIEGAQDYIYIETQFARSRPLRRALVKAAEAKPDLRVIMLMPGAPETVAYMGDTSRPQRYAEHLQAKFVAELTKAFGDRFGVFSLTGPRAEDETVERDALKGKGMVYVHAKLMLVDDARGIISSANMNGRSMRWDYEAGVVVNSSDTVKDWRLSLFGVHLSWASDEDISTAIDGEAMLALWRRLAKGRADKGEDAKGVGVVPYPKRRAERFSSSLPVVPENMV